MTAQEKDAIINSVIEIFLPSGNDKRSLSEELQESISREAICVAIRQVGGTVEAMPANYAAVKAIVVATKSEVVANFAAAKCMEIYDANKNQIFGISSNDALNAAINMLPYVSLEIKNRIIVAVAEKGWYGRIESLTKKYLGRGLTIKEVEALVESYVNNKGCRAQHQEAQLLRMAQAYAPKKIGEIRSKIRQFVQDFERDDMY